MFRDLTSRLCAVALVIALLAKPCLAFIESSPPGASMASQLPGPAFTRQLDEAVKTCSRFCLSARLEEAQPVAFRVKPNLTPAPLVLHPRLHWRAESMITAQAAPSSAPDNVRTRLAMLSRLLL